MHEAILSWEKEKQRQGRVQIDAGQVTPACGVQVPHAGPYRSEAGADQGLMAE